MNRATSSKEVALFFCFLSVRFQPVERNAGCPVVCVDYPAAPEPGLANYVPHHLVILMGVDAQIIAFPPAEIQARFKDAAASVACNAVNHTVWAFAVPCPILDYRIGSVRANGKRKNPMYPLLLRNDEQPAVRQILFQKRTGRLGFRPLGRISGLPHKTPGAGIYLENTVQIGLHRRPDHSLLHCNYPHVFHTLYPFLSVFQVSLHSRADSAHTKCKST